MRCHGSAMLFILRSRLLLYSAGSGLQVVLYGYSVKLFCLVQETILCRYGCMYLLVTLMLVCVDSVGERTKRCGTTVLN